jgi:FKBP-type peptidyl-prolyl cis-trans isomerase
MKRSLLVASMTAAIALTACNDKAAEAPAAAEATLESTLQKVSYGIGHNISSSFKQQGVELDMAAFEKGIADGSAGKEPVLDQATLMEAMQTFQQEQMEKKMAERSALEGTNETSGKAFLAENAKKEGVIVTESGLQYTVVTASGSGKKPVSSDTVVVHYKGTLLNGEEFDSSYSRNQPATFGVTQVIPGWTEMLMLMDEGDKVNVVIPSELAYGPSGAGEKIGPNATLVFDIELIDVVDAEAADEAAPAEAAAE